MSDNTVEDPTRLRRLAQRVGFGVPHIRDAGANKRAMDFHLPDRPPLTISRTMASAIILEPAAGGRFAHPPFDYVLGETTIRFPQAPDHYFEQAEVRDGAHMAIEMADDYPSGNLRFNPVVEEYAVHYDIPEEEMRAVDPEEFLRMTFEVAERFNRGMEGVY